MVWFELGKINLDEYQSIIIFLNYFCLKILFFKKTDLQ
jgi:hypothetical protein